MMNLKKDLVKNKETTIMRFNFTTMLVIFILLSFITTLFYSIPLGVIFTIVSVAYIIFLHVTKLSLLKKRNEKIHTGID